MYVAQASLFSIKWAEKFGQEDIDSIVVRCRIALDDSTILKQYIPKWYTDKYRNNFKKKEMK